MCDDKKKYIYAHEVEVLAVCVDDFRPNWHKDPLVEIPLGTELVDRQHVIKLQAEIQRLKSTAHNFVDEIYTRDQQLVAQAKEIAELRARKDYLENEIVRMSRAALPQAEKP